MNAVAALLFAAFFALAASNSVFKGTPDETKVVFRFASREFDVMPESRLFNGSEFEQPKTYEPKKETVVYFHGSNLLDPDTIYRQEFYIKKGFLKLFDCNMIVVFWDLLIQENATMKETFENARFVGRHTAELFTHIKTKFGGTTLRVVGSDFGAVAASEFIDNLKDSFPVTFFTIFNPNDIPELQFSKTTANLTFQVIFSDLKYYVHGCRNYFINDGTHQDGCPSSPDKVRDYCKGMQAFFNYFYSMYTADPKYEVTYCPSWEDYISKKCSFNPKIQLFNDVPKSDLPRGSYFGSFNTTFDDAFESYWKPLPF